MGLLVADNVRKVYGGRAVVDGVSITVTPGRITGLLGPNGAGKTTTFYMVVGAVRPDGGTIKLDGRDISRYPMHERARMGIGYLAQEASIFRDLSVWDNIMAILEFQKLSRADRRVRCQELVEELSLTHVQHSLGRALSGGERRRAEIARTLAASPQFILLDEPFAGVDPIAVGDIQRIVDYLRDKGLGILITDHNVRETLSICDHTYVMSEGTILVEGGLEEIVNHPQARESYLGEDFDMSGVTLRRDASRANRKDAGEAVTMAADAVPEAPPAPAPDTTASRSQEEAAPPEALPRMEGPSAESPPDLPDTSPVEPEAFTGKLAVWPPEPGQPMLADEVVDGGAPAGGDSIFGVPRRPPVAAGPPTDEEANSTGGISWPKLPPQGGDPG